VREPDTNPDGTVGSLATAAGFVHLSLYLWSRKWLILASAAAFGAIGLAYSFVLPPTYRAHAIIAIKDQQGGPNASGILSQLGGLGGMMASQFGVGSSNLDRLEVLARNRSVLEEVIKSENLLPELFPGLWDSGKSGWKDSATIPTLRMGVERMRVRSLGIRANPKQKNIDVEMEASDSTLAYRMLTRYLEELNRKIVSDAKSEEAANMSYLESQLDGSQDPLMREKLFQLIAMQVERTMLISMRAFDVIEPPAVPLMKDSPKRKRMALMWTFGGFVLSILAVTGMRWTREVIREALGGKA
jgi:hypothetical protein